MPNLTWIGKKAVENHHRQVPFHLLKDVPELSVGEPGSGNLIVEGDNLLGLKALLPYYAGQVKCIYIDPPYNTGEEKWIYNDNVNSPEMREWLGRVVGDELEDLTRHDKWLCMMYPRLTLLRSFLREDGVIFISLDDNEIGSLRILLDDIFGHSNFLASIIWQKRTSPDARLNLGPAHDYIVAYARDLALFKPTMNKVPASDQRRKSFKNPDNDPRGLWASVDITGQTGHATDEQYYEIVTPKGQKLRPPQGRCWALAEATVKQLIADNRIWFGKNGHSRPRVKKFLSEHEGVTTWTWWTNQEVGHNQEATKELKEIIGRPDAFDNPKPSRLIERIFQLATRPGDLIMDSFAGSGTSGHAILRMNKGEHLHRRFVLVEIDPKIAREITSERVKRVADGYQNSKGEKVDGLGGGFRFVTLGEPVFDPKGNIRSTVSFAELARHVYFTETLEPMPKQPKSNNPLIGVFIGRAIYLLYNGILRDKSPDGGNVLTTAVLSQLPKHDGAKVIYGTACRISKERLRKEGIDFKQLPYKLRVGVL
jgi:site-specific DNA-methyltransferase (adenine-specific)/adenine-specific DNA-methyltransferase